MSFVGFLHLKKHVQLHGSAAYAASEIVARTRFNDTFGSQVFLDEAGPSYFCLWIDVFERESKFLISEGLKVGSSLSLIVLHV